MLKLEILRVENLCKVYGSGEARVDALKHVSFSMQKGEFAAVVGASGSGKSTLLNCIGGLDDVFAMEENERTIFRRQNIGFIFQSFHLIPELNVEQNIIFPLLLDYKKPKRERVDEILEVLGLADRRKHLPGQLSGGQQQRAALARILASDPRAVLLDEPFAALDLSLRWTAAACGNRACVDYETDTGPGGRAHRKPGFSEQPGRDGPLM